MEHRNDEPNIHEIESRLGSLENWQHRQNGSIQRIEAKVDKMIYLHFAELAAIIGGLAALVHWSN